MDYSELARATGGALLRGPGSDPVGALCLDSRRIEPGQLFWALKGASFDAHAFLDEGLASRAGGWVVREGFALPAKLPSHVVAVPETLRALGALASHHRQRFSIPVAAITGSNGKTTTKEMLRAILAVRGPVCATSGNFNNEVGLPLTLLEMGPRTRFAVIEMGASRKGDIAYLCSLARPTLGILTNIGTAHLEFFGTIEGTFEAKTELVKCLEPDGPVVLNLDDPRLARLPPRIGGRAVTFGADPKAKVRILDAPPGVVSLLLPSGPLSVPMEGAGPAHRLNAAAAAAAAFALGFDDDSIARGLASYTPAPLRFQKRRHASGASLVIDAYNANPDSMRAGIETFLSTAPEGERLVVLGDMKELGPDSDRLHRELGRWLAAQPLAGAFLAGPAMAETARELESARPPFPVRHAPSAGDLFESLRPWLREGCAIFFKASRAMRLESLAEAL